MGCRSSLVSPETSSKSKPPSSTKIRMASRLPILLLLCLIPLLASALGEEERSHEVDAELQESVVKREAKKCLRNEKGCKKKKSSKKERKGNSSRRKQRKEKKFKKRKGKRPRPGQKKTKQEKNS